MDFLIAINVACTNAGYSTIGCKSFCRVACWSIACAIISSIWVACWRGASRKRYRWWSDFIRISEVNNWFMQLACWILLYGIWKVFLARKPDVRHTRRLSVATKTLYLVPRNPLVTLNTCSSDSISPAIDSNNASFSSSLISDLERYKEGICKIFRIDCILLLTEPTLMVRRRFLKKSPRLLRA